MISLAGEVLLVETVRQGGLDAALSAALEPRRKPAEGPRPGRDLLNLALAGALGGD
ncbi:MULTISPECIES: hypothetical protein [Kitasatospora]|uniref:Uncharacterized protein n=1 Tax=Kitasatospora cystarginea TaxID=58350 RepID=A0ABP5Q8K1_9ACTN